jgi:hypothetical protein
MAKDTVTSLIRKPTVSVCSSAINMPVAKIGDTSRKLSVIGSTPIIEETQCSSVGRARVQKTLIVCSLAVRMPVAKLSDTSLKKNTDNDYSPATLHPVVKDRATSLGENTPYSACSPDSIKRRLSWLP